MTYLVAKALHFVGLVSWFAGLLYVVRLFVYDVEAGARPESERRVLQEQLRIMERRLWYGITWPALAITFASGMWMVVSLLSYTGNLPVWLHVKLALLAALVAYHLQCGRLRARLERDACRWTSRQLRAWNEVGTLLLVAIVFTAVFRDALAVVWGAVGLVVLALVLMTGLWVYERLREPGSSDTAR